MQGLAKAPTRINKFVPQSNDVNSKRDTRSTGDTRTHSETRTL